MASPDELVAQGAKSMAHQRELGEWWRLMTGSLLHAGGLHLIINLLFLLYVGRNIEAILGPGGIALLIAVSGPGSMAISSWATEAATVGASGVTFGFRGSSCSGLALRRVAPAVRSGEFGWPMFPFVLSLLLGVQSSGVDNSCHVGGLLLGGALGFVLPSPLARTSERRRRLALKELIGAAGLTLALSLVLPLAWRSVRSLTRRRAAGNTLFPSWGSLSTPSALEPKSIPARGPSGCRRLVAVSFLFRLGLRSWESFAPKMCVAAGRRSLEPRGC